MRLYLVQHGEALATEVDPDRPLSDSGQRDVQRLAALLGRGVVGVARIVHSGKTRARQTAEILAAGLAGVTAAEAQAGLGPNDPVEPWMARAAGWDTSTMIVGHLPFMDRLVSGLLVGAPLASVVAFRPGSIVCLVNDGGGAWQIGWMLRPELLVDRT